MGCGLQEAAFWWDGEVLEWLVSPAAHSLHGGDPVPVSLNSGGSPSLGKYLCWNNCHLFGWDSLELKLDLEAFSTPRSGFLSNPSLWRGVRVNGLDSACRP